jgi:oligopeptide transport system permease protein
MTPSSSCSAPLFETRKPLPTLPSLPSPSLGPWQAAWLRLRRQRSATLALGFLLVITLACLLGPSLTAFEESQQNLDAVAQAPSITHWMGTDLLGRDLLTRILLGGRISLFIGLVATLVAMLIGVAYGLISGMAGGRLDNAMMRFVDVLYGFPFMAFVILLTVIFERSLVLLFVAIGAVEWLTTARVVRGQVLSLMNQEFVLAARVSGAGSLRILWRHLVPNVMGQVVIYASLTVPGIMLLEAVLSFLGLGVQPPQSSWGTLIQEGANNMETSPWMLLFPGSLFIATLLALNTLGDALRDALDPKSDSGR